MGNGKSKPSKSKKKKKAKSESSIDMSKLRGIFMEEISRHDSKEKGIWIIINNLVYDVTDFLDKHPGGAGFLLTVAGEDATDEYESACHPKSSIQEANKLYLIGKLIKNKTEE